MTVSQRVTSALQAVEPIYQHDLWVDGVMVDTGTLSADSGARVTVNTSGSRTAV
jgi:hypothetical protein